MKCILSSRPSVFLGPENMYRKRCHDDGLMSIIHKLKTSAFKTKIPKIDQKSLLRLVDCTCSTEKLNHVIFY